MSPPPSFFFAHERGRSPLRLHKVHAERKQDKPEQELEAWFSHETCAVKPYKGWADEASSRTHPVRAIAETKGKNWEARK